MAFGHGTLSGLSQAGFLGVAPVGARGFTSSRRGDGVVPTPPGLNEQGRRALDKAGGAGRPPCLCVRRAGTSIGIPGSRKPIF